MKKTDITLIIMIATISVVTAFFIARAVFGDVYSGKATVKTIEAISSTVEEPSTDVFNKDAINPSVRVQIQGTDSTTQ